MGLDELVFVQGDLRVTLPFALLEAGALLEGLFLDAEYGDDVDFDCRLSGCHG